MGTMVSIRYTWYHLVYPDFLAGVKEQKSEVIVGSQNRPFHELSTYETYPQTP